MDGREAVILARKIGAALHHRMDTDDIVQEIHLFLLEEQGRNRYRPEQGDLAGYVYRSLVFNLGPSASAVRAEMPRQRDSREVQDTKKLARQSAFSLDDDEFRDVAGEGSFYDDPLAVALLSEADIPSMCPTVAHLVLDKGHPHDLPGGDKIKPEIRRMIVERELTVAVRQLRGEVDEDTKKAIERLADMCAKKRGPRGSYKKRSQQQESSEDDAAKGTTANENDPEDGDA